MGKGFRYVVILLFWVNLTAVTAFGQPATSLYIYEDISNRWMIYEYKEKLYVPYLPGVHPQARRLHMIVRPTAWKPATKLILPVKKEALIFVNNNLSHHIRQAQTLVWDLDSMAALGSQLLLTYAPVGGIEKEPHIFLGGQRASISTHPKPTVATEDTTTVAPSITVAQEMPTMQLRQPAERQNYLLLTALLCSIVLSIFSLIDRKYVSITESLRMLFQLFKLRDLQEKNEFRSLLIIGLIFATTAAYLLMLVTSYPQSFVQVPVSGNNSRFFVNYLKVTGWLLLILWLKYALIKILDGIFSHRLLAEKHIAINLHIYKIFILIVFVLFVAYQLSHYYHTYISPQVLSYVLLWGWVAVVVLTGMVLYLSVAQQFVYLIAYLCTTELLPLVLLLKLFLIPS